MKPVKSTKYKGHMIAVYLDQTRGGITGEAVFEEIRVGIDGVDVTSEVIAPIDVTTDTMVEYAKQYIDNL